MSEKDLLSVNKKFFIFQILLITTGFFYVQFVYTSFTDMNIEDIKLNQQRTQRAKESIKCYLHEGKFNKIEGKRLQDILKSSRQPTKGKTIFFHITECNASGELYLKPREACAIETAAFKNPSADVFVLFASPTYVPDNFNSSVAQSLLKYKNVFLRNVDIWRYTKGTPAEGWFRGEEMFRSDFLSTHLSEFLRLVTLWRYSGIHLNLDVLTLNDLYYFPPNAIGALDNFTVSNAIINLGYNQEGHQAATVILKHFIENFQGDSLHHNGDNQLTSVLKERICKVNKTELMTPENCAGLDIYPVRCHYPIEKQDAHYMFEEKYIGDAMKMTHFTLTVRLWDQVTRNRKYKVGSVTAFGLHAYSKCPRVYRATGEYL